MNNERRKKKDISLLLILAILLPIPFAIDEAFNLVKSLLRAQQRSSVPATSASSTPISAPNCTGNGCASPAETNFPGKGGSNTEWHSRSRRSGIEALEILERQQIDAINQNLRNRFSRNTSEVWMPIEPRPSNPSRFFPELPKPRLSSGIEFTFSRAETKKENIWRRGKHVNEKTSANTWGSLEADEARENRPAPTLQFHSPVTAEAPPAEAENIAITPVKTRSTEEARTEKLIEVCGRIVPISRAATVSMECSPRLAPTPHRKPASENVDLGGGDKVLLP